MKKLMVILSLAILVLAACHNDQQEAKKYYVSILPQKFFVEKIVEDKFEIAVLVKPGESPATYEPTTKQMIDLSKTKALFSIGVPFEQTIIPKLKEQYPNLEIIATDKGINKHSPESYVDLFHDSHSHHEHEVLENEYAHKHEGLEKKHEHGHKHEGLDPHIWLSPKLVEQQVRNIADYFISAYPQDADFFADNRDKFIKELQAVSQEIKVIFANNENREFLCFHPAWGYFADDFDLKQIPIEIEGKEPTPQEQKRIMEFAKDKGIKFIFVQAQFDQKIAQSIAEEIGGSVILIDPLAQDYLSNLKNIASKIAESMEQ
jgi:zinc transport system substrate-binding protein